MYVLLSDDEHRFVQTVHPARANGHWVCGHNSNPVATLPHADTLNICCRSGSKWFYIIKKKIFSLQNPLELNPGHVSNLSYNFGDNMMIRSGKNKCICVQNLQWESMGK